MLSGQTNKDGGAFTSDGMYITLTGGTNNVHAGSIGSKHFRLKGETGEVELGSTVTGSGGGAISLNSSTQKITITDGSTPRVIIGKLS